MDKDETRYVVITKECELQKLGYKFTTISNLPASRYMTKVYLNDTLVAGGGYSDDRWESKLEEIEFIENYLAKGNTFNV